MIKSTKLDSVQQVFHGAYAATDSKVNILREVMRKRIPYPGSAPDTKIGRPKARPYSTYNLILPNTQRKALEKIATQRGVRLCQVIRDANAHYITYWNQYRKSKND